MLSIVFPQSYVVGTYQRFATDVEYGRLRVKNSDGSSMAVLLYGKLALALDRDISIMVPRGTDLRDARLALEIEGQEKYKSRTNAKGVTTTERYVSASGFKVLTGPAAELQIARREGFDISAKASALAASGDYEGAYAALSSFAHPFTRFDDLSPGDNLDVSVQAEDSLVSILAEETTPNTITEVNESLPEAFPAAVHNDVNKNASVIPSEQVTIDESANLAAVALVARIPRLLTDPVPKIDVPAEPKLFADEPEAIVVNQDSVVTEISDDVLPTGALTDVVTIDESANLAAVALVARIPRLFTDPVPKMDVPAEPNFIPSEAVQEDVISVTQSDSIVHQVDLTDVATNVSQHTEVVEPPYIESLVVVSETALSFSNPVLSEVPVLNQAPVLETVLSSPRRFGSRRQPPVFGSPAPVVTGFVVTPSNLGHVSTALVPSLLPPVDPEIDAARSFGIALSSPVSVDPDPLDAPMGQAPTAAPVPAFIRTRLEANLHALPSSEDVPGGIRP